MAASGGTLTWSTTSVTLAVGETVTVNYTTTFSEVQSANFTSLIASVATFTEGTNKINLTGTAAGTVTIAANTTVGFETVTTNALTITVTAPVDDQNFLNERGLARFWNNIDTLKQDKLTAGTNITINNGTISATQPTVGNATLTIQKNGASAGTFTANATSNKTINITVPTTAADVSALPASTKYGASIAVGINTTDYKVTTTLKDQDGNTLGTAQVIDLPLESVVVNGSYDNTNKKIVLTLQNGNTIDIPVADLVAGLQSEITSTNKLASDLVDDTNQTHKFMTSAEKTKLSGIAAGAEVNVQSDWDQTTTTADDYIKNKPSIPTKTSDLTNDSNFVSDANYVHTDNNYTTTEKNKLAGIAAGAEVNVQANWTQTTTTADDYIKNKPTLATVATSGSYNDLSNKPTIPEIKKRTGAATTTNITPLYVAGDGTTTTPMALKTHGDDHMGSFAYVNINEPTNDISEAYIGGYVWDEYEEWWRKMSEKKLALYSDIPTVNNGTLTVQKNGTNVQTFTANQSTNATANITVPTKTSDLTNDSDFVTSSGTVAKANQLTTARTISISGGVTGTATSFNGTSNISIPVTYVRDAYTIWGGKDLVSDISPDDAGCIDEFGHNKLAFLPAECIEVKYSTDGGTTWTDYGLTDAQKIALVTTSGPGIGAGKNATINASNIANMRGRVRIACGTMAKSGKIYTALKKILINFSTNGATNTKIRIRRRTIANYLSGTETWEDLGTHNIGGWSGWNSYGYGGNFGGNMTSQTGQPGQIEFEFWGETFNSSYNSRCSLIDIRFIGTTNWTTPSELARAGHLYTMDTGQNATFPANVGVTGSLQHGNYTYTLPNKNGTVAMTSDIPSVPTVNNGQLTIQKNGSNVATFTANQSGNATANITVPTKTSDLTNDGGSGSGAYMDEFAIHATGIDTANGTFTSDKTFNEVKAAYESGKNIILYATIPESGYSNDYLIPLDNVYIDETYGEYSFYFDFSIANAMGTGTPIVGGVSNMYVGFYISRYGSSSSDYEYYYGYDRKDASVSITGSLATRPTNNTWVPSAQCVYDAIGDVESVLQTLNSGTGV